MKRFKKNSILIIIYLLISSLLKANEKMLVLVDFKDLQPGTQINEGINGLLKLACQKEIIFNESPAKKRIINREEICDMKSGFPIYSNKLMRAYIYFELIPKKDKSFQYKTNGFSMIFKNQENTIGLYLDMEDPINRKINTINSLGMECNFIKNGFEDILSSLDYNYDVVYFKNKEVTDFSESEKIKKKYIPEKKNGKYIKEVIFSTKDMFQKDVNHSANIDDSFNSICSDKINSKVIFPKGYEPIKTNVFYTNIITQIGFDKKGKIIDTNFISFEVMLPNQMFSNRIAFVDIPVKKYNIIKFIKKNMKGLGFLKINNSLYEPKNKDPKLDSLPCLLIKK